MTERNEQLGAPQEQPESHDDQLPESEPASDEDTVLWEHYEKWLRLNRSFYGEEGIQEVLRERKKQPDFLAGLKESEERSNELKKKNPGRKNWWEIKWP